MDISRESIQARLDGLLKGEEEVLQELFLTRGAIEDCRYWLGVLEHVSPQLSESAEIKAPEFYSCQA